MLSFFFEIIDERFIAQSNFKVFAFDITTQVVREKTPFCLAIVIDLS